MIPNKEKKDGIMLNVKKLSAILYRKTSKYHGDFYCLNCLYSFGTEDLMNLIKRNLIKSN